MIKIQAKPRITAEQAISTVQDFVADNLGDLVGVGQPCRMVTALRASWVVPLVLTSPGYGIVGLVGVVTVDDELGHIVGWTPIDDIRLNAQRVSLDKETELESAFQSLLTSNSPQGIDGHTSQ